jgi:hypothetical protein
MHSYEDFPPYPYFISVLRQCPRAAWTYILLWQAREEDQEIRVNRSEIMDSFFMSPTVFKNNLMFLVSLGILSVKEKKGQIYDIELVDFDEEEFDSIEAS